MDQIEAIRRLLDDKRPLRDPAGAAAAEAEAKADAQASRLIGSGRPKGVPLQASLTQEYLTGRPPAYKAQAADHYREATKRVRKLYRDIDARASLSGASVRDVAASFLPLLKSDKNLLLNLPSLPSSDPDFLYAHAVDSSLLSLAIAAHAGHSEEQAMEIAVSALLLDVGMVRVPEAIRNKAGALSPAEKSEILKHPIVGADLLHPIPDLPPEAGLAAYQHHERLTGAGYPKGRSGHLIHEYSRILAIADTYAAMVRSRSYRAPLLPYHAVEVLLRLGRAGQLDARLIRRLLEALSLFPVGSLVRLASGRVGKVIQAGRKDFTRPVLAVLRLERGRAAPPGALLDLAAEDGGGADDGGGAEDGGTAGTGGDRIVEALAPEAIAQDPMDGF